MKGEEHLLFFFVFICEVFVVIIGFMSDGSIQ